MGLLGQIPRIANRTILAPTGFRLMRTTDLYPWQQNDVPQPVPEVHRGARIAPRPDRLRELIERYRNFDKKATRAVLWTERTEELAKQLDSFRGHNMFLWQIGENNNPSGLISTYYYAKSCDSAGLLDKLEEDGSFGAVTLEVDGRLVSRDLLDSVREIDFLNRQLGVLDAENLDVLDIGAGYGRLAARMSAARSGPLRYLCTDAVPASTYLCESYLDHLGITGRARAVPLDEVEEAAQGSTLAINVNSFPECHPDAIAWWLDLLVRLDVKHLFLVPNALDTLGNEIKTFRGVEFRSMIEERGFRLVAKEPKYRDPALQQWGLSPTQFYLFGR